MSTLLHLFNDFRWEDGLDILLVAFALYVFLLMLREARGLRILVGFGALFLAGALASWFHLLTVEWLLSNLWPVLVIALVVVFQPDLRRLMNQLVRYGGWGGVFRGEAAIFKEITRAAKELVKSRHGALIVLERGEPLDSILESGTRIDAEVSADLLVSLFTPGTPLHDGAVVLRSGRAVSAGCILPLSQNPNLSRTYGTRHRAALGLTEETDALAVVVSEETGTISLVMAGKMTPGIDSETLEEMLTLYGTKTS
jgi:diadenylate cyclase